MRKSDSKYTLRIIAPTLIISTTDLISKPRATKKKISTTTRASVLEDDCSKRILLIKYLSNKFIGIKRIYAKTEPIILMSEPI